MKNILKIVTLSAFICFWTNLSPAQWVQTDGPYYGAITSILVHPGAGGTILFAANNTGVYRSIDNGETWHRTGFTGSASVLAAIGSNLFAGGGWDGSLN